MRQFLFIITNSLDCVIVALDLVADEPMPDDSGEPNLESERERINENYSCNRCGI